MRNEYWHSGVSAQNAIKYEGGGVGVRVEHHWQTAGDRRSKLISAGTGKG